MNDYEVEKHTAFTIEEARKHVDNTQLGVDVFALHVITNHVKRSSAEKAAEDMKGLVKAISDKHKNSKVVISLGPPRDDNNLYKLKTQLANTILTDEFKSSDQVTLVSNDNMSMHNGHVQDNLFLEDRIHLSSEGTRVLWVLCVCWSKEKRRSHGRSHS